MTETTKPNAAQMASPSYRMAAMDQDFLLGDSMRGVRFLMEYAKPEREPRPERAPGRLVLLADGSRAHRRMLRIHLERAGYRVIEAEDGSEALRLARAQRLLQLAREPTSMRAAYPDDLQFDPASEYYDPRSGPGNPRWSMVDVAPVLALPRLLPLDELRDLPAWQDSPLTRKGTRLSVLPAEGQQFWEALDAAGLSLEDLNGLSA